MAAWAARSARTYLPVPGEHAHEVTQWLRIGLRRVEAGPRGHDERHLCHSPQERLFIDGRWVDGLLPLDGAARRRARAPTLAQYRRFAQRWSVRRLGADCFPNAQALPA